MYSFPVYNYSLVNSQEYESINGIPFRVEIYQMGSSPPAQPFNIDLAGNSLSIILMGDGTPYQKIKTHEFLIQVNSIIDRQYLETFVYNNFEFQIRIYRDGAIIHTGYIVPDIFSEAFTTPPYPTQLSFICGLAMLKNFNFADDNGVYYRGYYSGITILANCLSRLRGDLQIMDAVPIVDAARGQWEPYLENHFYNAEMFRGLNCYEVVERLLPFGCKIQQVDNQWQVTPVDQFRYNFRLYDRDGNGIAGSDGEKNTVNEMTNAKATLGHRITFIRDTQELTIAPGWKDFSLYHDYGKKESILPTPDFEADDFLDGVPRGWGGENIRHAEIEGESCLEFMETTEIENSYITCVPGEYKYNGPDRFRLTFEQQIGTLQPVSGQALFMFTSTGERRSSIRPYVAIYQGDGSAQFRIDSAEAVALIQGGGGFRVVLFDSPPANTKPSWYYWIDSPTYIGNQARFRLTEGDGSMPLLMGTAAGTAYNLLLAPTYNLCNIRVGQDYATQAGLWDIRRRLLMEIDQRAFSDRRFRSSSYTTLIAPGSGQISVRIEKPLPRVASGGTWGSAFLKSLKLEITTAREGELHEYRINDKFNLRGDEFRVYHGPIYELQGQSLSFIAMRLNAAITATFTVQFIRKGRIGIGTITLDPVNMAESAARAKLSFNSAMPFNSISIAEIQEITSDNQVIFSVVDLTGESIVIHAVTSVNASYTTYITPEHVAVDPNQGLKYFGTVKYRNNRYIDKHKRQHFNQDTGEYAFNETETLIDIAARFFKSLYSKPSYQLRGTVNSYPNLNNRVLFDRFTERSYMITDYGYSTKFDTFDCSMTEILHAPSVIRGDFNKDFNRDFR